MRVLTLVRASASNQWGPASTQVRVQVVESPLPDTLALAIPGVFGVEVPEEESAMALPELDILVVVEILLDDVGLDELCFGFHA